MDRIGEAMAQVASEAIEEIDYEPSQSIMFVRFSNGGWYSYFGVDAGTYEAFIAAPSHGRFFHEKIRNRYFFRRGR